MRLPKLLTNSAIYTAVTLLQRCASFFLLPLYTTFLTPTDYGTVNVVLSVSSFVAVLIMVALNGAATRLHYKNKNLEYRSRVWGTITTLVLANSILFGVLFISLHKYLVDPFIGNIDFYPFALIALSYAVISPLYILFQSYLQASQNAVFYGANTLLNFFLQVFLTILFVVHYRMGALGMLCSYAVTALFFFIYVSVAFLPKIKLGIDKGISMFSFRFSLPLLPHQISLWSAGTIDKLFLNGIKGTAVAGLYGIAQQCGNVVGTIAYSFNQAFVPWFYEMLEEGNEGKRRIQQAGLCIVLGYCIIALGLSLFSREVLSIMVSESFRDAFSIIPFVAFAMVLNGTYYLFINVLLIDKTEFVFVATLSGLVVNILANIILIPPLGYYGCGIACFLTYLTRSVVALILSKKKNKEIRYNYVTMYLTTFVFLLLALFLMLVISDITFGGIILKMAIFVIAIIVFMIHYKPLVMQILRMQK